MIEELRAIVGEKNVLEATEVALRSAGAFRFDHLQAEMLVRPASTEEVARIVFVCAMNAALPW